jgi:hypothetical protein
VFSFRDPWGVVESDTGQYSTEQLRDGSTNEKRLVLNLIPDMHLFHVTVLLGRRLVSLEDEHFFVSFVTWWSQNSHDVY